MAGRILAEFVKIKEYPVSEQDIRETAGDGHDRAGGSMGQADRQSRAQARGGQIDQGKTRWIWVDGRLLKCAVAGDAVDEREGGCVEIYVEEKAGLGVIFGKVDHPRRSDPSCDYVVENEDGRRFGVLFSLKKSPSEPFNSNVTLKNLDNDALCDGNLSLKSKYLSDGIEARYYPGLYINKKDETWKVVVRMEAFSRNVSFRRSDGRLCNGKYTLLKEIPFSEEARPLEKDTSINSEYGPISPITQDEHYLILELSQPTGGRLVVSPDLANFDTLPPACCIGLNFIVKTPLSASGLEASASEVNGKVVVEAKGITWGIEAKNEGVKNKNSSTSDIWAKLEQAADHYESHHSLRLSAEAREKSLLLHGDQHMQEVPTEEFKSPKSILKQGSGLKKSMDKKLTFADNHEEQHRLQMAIPIESLKKDETPAKSGPQVSQVRSSSETRIISEKKTYFENGQIVTVVRDFKVSEDGEKIPVDSKLSDTMGQCKNKGTKKQTSTLKQVTKPANNQPQMPIKKTPVNFRGNKKIPGAPEHNLMVAFEEFIDAMPVKVEPEILFPLFKEMTARAIGLVSEVAKKPKK